MLKVLKFKCPDELYVWSDLHFSHQLENVWRKRGFNSVAEHDNTLINRWNETVSPTGKVIFLGDFMLNGSVEKCKEYLFRLNGHIYMLFGNHNASIKDIYKEALLEQGYGNEVECYPITWKNKVTFVGENLNFYWHKRFFVCSHFPYKIWDYQKHGAVQLAGHSHSGDPTRNPDYPDGKCLDMGVENFPAPVPISKIIEITDKKKYVKLDEHH